jgi:hypothetical protein
MSDGRKEALRKEINALDEVMQRSINVKKMCWKLYHSEVRRVKRIREKYHYKNNFDERNLSDFQNTLSVIKSRCSQKTRDIFSVTGKDKTCLVLLLPISVDNQHHINEMVHYCKKSEVLLSKKVILDHLDRKTLNNFFKQIENGIEHVSKIVLITHEHFISVSHFKNYIKNKCSKRTYDKILRLSERGDILVCSFQESVNDIVYSNLPVYLSREIIKSLKKDEINHLEVLYWGSSHISVITSWSYYVKRLGNILDPFLFNSNTDGDTFFKKGVISKLRSAFLKRGVWSTDENGDQSFFHLLSFYLQCRLQELLFASIDNACVMLGSIMDSHGNAYKNSSEKRTSLVNEYNKVRRFSFDENIKERDI